MASTCVGGMGVCRTQRWQTTIADEGVDGNGSRARDRAFNLEKSEFDHLEILSAERNNCSRFTWRQLAASSDMADSGSSLIPS